MAGYHTPGPWDVSFGRNDAAIHAGGTIAMIDDVMTGWRANAALIAAAPDLLATLELIDSHLTRCINFLDINHELRERLEAQQVNARAAIAKAVTL